MNIRQIKVEKESEDAIEEVLKQIAYWHNLTPKLWHPSYLLSEEDIVKTMERIKKTPKKDLFLAGIFDDAEDIKGFIWAYRLMDKRNRVMILSLYIKEEYRKRGYATDLKKALEGWCLEQGVQYIDTTTHYNNKKMIQLNQKLGYQPSMVKLTKCLDK